MKINTTIKLVLFAALSICALPLAQGQALFHTEAFMHLSSAQLTLILMYTTPPWTAAVLVFIQDSFRAEAMQEAPTPPYNSALRLGLFGFLTNVIALAINPVVQEVSLPSLAHLVLAGAGVGLACGGLLWPLLRKNPTKQPDTPNTIKTKIHG